MEIINSISIIIKKYENLGIPVENHENYENHLIKIDNK